MNFGVPDGGVTSEQIAWELAELFNDMSTERVNEMLANNVPVEILRFATGYGDDFSEVHGLDEGVRCQLPNLVVLGYLLRVLEERLVEDSCE